MFCPDCGSQLIRSHALAQPNLCVYCASRGVAPPDVEAALNELREAAIACVEAVAEDAPSSAPRDAATRFARAHVAYAAAVHASAITHAVNALTDEQLKQVWWDGEVWGGDSSSWFDAALARASLLRALTGAA